MANIVQGRPTESSDAGDFARQLLSILGPAYSAPDGSNNAADMLALGGALAAVRTVLSTALAQAFATDASVLLSELETSYGLPMRTDLSTADRQIRLVAKIRAARSGSPQAVLRSVQAYDPTATLLENTPSVSRDPDTSTHAGAMRAVFQFAIVVTVATWNDPNVNAAIRALLEQMKPSHAGYSLCVNANFLCDDPNSLCDRDVIGS